MDAVVGVCAHCRRPNDENEIEQALAQEGLARQAARGRVKRIAAWGVLLVIATGLIVGREAVKNFYLLLRKPVDAALEIAAGGEAAPAVAISSAAAPPLGVLTAEPIHVSTVIAYSPPSEVPLGEGEWSLAGRAFDLKTLKPIAGARLMFTIGGSGGVFGTTDMLGEFRIALPKGVADGFTVHFATSGYAPLALCERDIPYADLSTSDREQLIGVALEGDGPASHVFEPTAGAGVRSHQDLFFAPRARQ